MAFRFRVLGSGSSGNATLVEAAGTRVLIDAGLGPRELAERLQSAGVDPGSVQAVFLTHEHSDHARGAASFSRKWGVRLAGTRGTYAAAGFGACEIAGYDVISAGEHATVGALRVTAVRVPHDAAEPVAFVVGYGDDCLGHATDLGHLSREVVEAFRDCRALLVESNYDPGLLRDGPYPWSLKERILGAAGTSLERRRRPLPGGRSGFGCEQLVLAHLSQKNNHPELVRMSAEQALDRAGRADVALTITNADGTGWVDVAPARAPEQLRLI